MGGGGCRGWRDQLDARPRSGEGAWSSTPAGAREDVLGQSADCLITIANEMGLAVRRSVGAHRSCSSPLEDDLKMPNTARWLVASRRFERLACEPSGRLAHANSGDDGGEKAKNGERVKPAAETAGGVFEPADDRWAGAAA